ncbi:MAG: AI-2E family transporter [Planctomycetaceae bacterium]
MSAPSMSSGNGVSYLYMAAAFVVVTAGLKAAEAIVNPLLLAVFLAVISAPAYFGLVRRGVAEWLSMLIVIFALTVIVLGLLYFVVGSIASFTSRQDHYISLLAERKRDIQRRVEGWLPARKEPVDEKHATEPGDEEAADGAPDSKTAPETNGSQPNSPPSELTDDEPADGRNPVAARVNDTNAPPDEGSQTPRATPSDDSADDITHALLHAEAEPADEDKRDDDDRPGSVPLDTNIAVFDQVPAHPKTWTELAYAQFDPGTVISLAAQLASSIGQLLGNAFLILLTVIFILMEVGSFSKKIDLAFVRTDEMASRATEIINSIQHYLAIKTMMSLLTGVLLFFWLLIFNVPYAGLWGLLAFLLNYIPNVGSVIAAIPAVLIAWLELGTMPAIAALIGYLLVNTAVGNFLEPRLMGRGLGLSVLVVFCSMVFWGWVLGPVGMLLSVPLTMTARIALEGFDDTKWIGTLMGNAGTVKVSGKQPRVVS